jgi:hypothetical protein
LTLQDFLAWQLPKEKYDTIFKIRSTVVVYNDEICYGMHLLKLNNYNTNCNQYGNLIDKFAKAQNQWFENGCSF